MGCKRIFVHEIVANFNVAIEQNRDFIAIKPLQIAVMIDVNHLDVERRADAAPEVFQCREQVITEVTIRSR